MFLCVNTCVVRPNAAVKKGEIALTMPQKAACKVTGTGSTISVKVRACVLCVCVLVCLCDVRLFVLVVDLC